MDKFNPPQISTIVPVYNVETYINKCIDSVLSQTYKDWELILVDDGSTDNSGKICDEYALKDNRIKVIHKENGGAASARYKGIESSNGKFIFFLDGDDYIPEDALINLYTTYTKDNFNADIITGNAYYIDTNNHILKYFNRGNFKILVNEEIANYIYTRHYKSLSGILISKFLFKNLILKPTDIYMGEDLIVIYQILAFAKRMINSEKTTYYYLNRQNSAVNDIDTEKSHKDDFIKLIKYYNNLLEKLPISNKAKSALKVEIVRICHTYIRICKRYGTEKRFLKNQLKYCYKDKNTRQLLKKYFSRKYYYLSYLIFFSPKLWAYIIHSRINR